MELAVDSPTGAQEVLRNVLGEGILINTTLQTLHLTNVPIDALVKDSQTQQRDSNNWLPSDCIPWKNLAHNHAHAQHSQGLIEICFLFDASMTEQEFAMKVSQGLFPHFQEVGFDGMEQQGTGFVLGVRFFKVAAWHALKMTHNKDNDNSNNKESLSVWHCLAAYCDRQQQEADEFQERRAVEGKPRYSPCYGPLLPRFAERRIEKKKDKLKKSKSKPPKSPSPVSRQLGGL